MFAVLSTGQTIHLGKFRQSGGWGEGTANFAVTPGLSDVVEIYAKIDWYYGFGEDKLRLAAMWGDLIVLV